MNSVNLIGNLTRAPELRQAGETAVTTLRLAFSSREKKPDGEWGDTPNYIDVTVWGRQAELAVEHLERGRQVAVSGRLRWREWEADDGSKRQAVEVVAHELQYLAKPKEDRSGEPIAAGVGSQDEQSGDDVPF